MKPDTNNLQDPYIKICKYQFCERKKFIARRLNQDYCCKDHKIKVNNLKAKVIRDATKTTDFYLKNNRRILEGKYKIGKTEVTLDELENQGFIYNYHTTTKIETNYNVKVPFYFEFGLVKISSGSPNSFKIVKQ